MLAGASRIGNSCVHGTDVHTVGLKLGVVLQTLEKIVRDEVAMTYCKSNPFNVLSLRPLAITFAP